MGASVSASNTCANSKAPTPSNIVINSSPTTPDWEGGTYAADPNYGFDCKKRKERVPPITKDQLVSAKVEPKYRDFCAHKMLEFKKCTKDNFPFHLKCHHEKHAFEECQYEEYIIRMKEYERDRRLLHRKQRKEAAAAKEAKKNQSN